jgi:hypothetical protein
MTLCWFLAMDVTALHISAHLTEDIYNPVVYQLVATSISHLIYNPVVYQLVATSISHLIYNPVVYQLVATSCAACSSSSVDDICLVVLMGHNLI